MVMVVIIETVYKWSSVLQVIDTIKANKIWKEVYNTIQLEGGQTKVWPWGEKKSSCHVTAKYSKGSIIPTTPQGQVALTDYPHRWKKERKLEKT